MTLVTRAGRLKKYKLCGINISEKIPEIITREVSMNIAWGQTRFVLLWGSDAIKVARFRPVRFLARLPLLVFSKKRRAHFFKKYGDSFFSAMKNDLFAGVIANRVEYDYSMRYSDWRIMPIRAVFLGGWIVVQERGDSVSAGELAQESPLKRPFFVRGKSHLSDPHQFCRNSEGRVVLVDYGNEATQQYLRETAV